MEHVTFLLNLDPLDEWNRSWNPRLSHIWGIAWELLQELLGRRAQPLLGTGRWLVRRSIFLLTFFNFFRGLETKGLRIDQKLALRSHVGYPKAAAKKLLVPNAAGIPGGVQTDRWYRPKILMSIDFVRKVRWCDLKCPLILLLGVNIKVNAPDPVRCIDFV